MIFKEGIVLGVVAFDVVAFLGGAEEATTLTCPPKLHFCKHAIVFAARRNTCRKLQCKPAP